MSKGQKQRRIILQDFPDLSSVVSLGRHNFSDNVKIWATSHRLNVVK